MKLIINGYGSPSLFVEESNSQFVCAVFKLPVYLCSILISRTMAGGDQREMRMEDFLLLCVHVCFPPGTFTGLFLPFRVVDLDCVI